MKAVATVRAIKEGTYEGSIEIGGFKPPQIEWRASINSFRILKSRNVPSLAEWASTARAPLPPTAKSTQSGMGSDSVEVRKIVVVT